MSDVAVATRSAPRPTDAVAGETAIARRLLIAVAIAFLGLFLLLPLAIVFTEAFAEGAGAYFQTFGDADVRAAIGLTLMVAAIAVSMNVAFGFVAAWAIAKFDFVGKNLLITLIDLPFSVSPVVSGLIFVLVFGAQGVFGPWVAAHGFHVIFATPGIVLATVFITFPFVARELIPLMQAQGTAEEEAALTLGASGFKTVLTVTLPNVKWALLYGVLLCNARAMGEFGAVSVVSGHVSGLTETIPLQIESLYDDYQSTAAFALSALLACLGLVTLGVKYAVEARAGARAG